MRPSKAMLLLVVAAFLAVPFRTLAEEITSGLATVNDTKLYYEVAGTGHPLVFIHGGVLDSTEWDEQFLALAAHYRVIRYDVRGFGKSETRKLPYSDVADLYGLLQFLKVEKAFLLGGSSGGAIAIDFTLEHPDMVKALVLVGSVVSGWPYSPELMQRGYKILMVAVQEGAEKAADLWLADPSLIPAPENPRARQEFRHRFIAGFHGFLAPWYLARPLNPPALKRLSEIHVPTLLILGQLDVAEVFAVADTLSANISGMKKIVVPNAGHLVAMEKPQEFTHIVRDFLEKR